jgi:two-component system chemotaxis response regulator CheB
MKTYGWKRGRAVLSPPPSASAHGHYRLVTMAASAGGVRALERVLAELPDDFPAPIAIVQHRSGKDPNLMARVLSRHTPLVVKIAEEGDELHPGTVYLAPPQWHLVVGPGGRFALADGRRIRHVLSSANPLFESAARELDGRVIAVVLTGYGRDATDGVQAVKLSGGTVLAQDEASAERFDMPRSAIETGCVDRIVPLPQIATELKRLVQRSAGDQHRQL